MLKKLKIKNYRGFVRKTEFNFGKINIFVGPNSVGKTSLLQLIEHIVKEKSLDEKEFEKNISFRDKTKKMDLEFEINRIDDREFSVINAFKYKKFSQNELMKILNLKKFSYKIDYEYKLSKTIELANEVIEIPNSLEILNNSNIKFKVHNNYHHPRNSVEIFFNPKILKGLKINELKKIGKKIADNAQKKFKNQLKKISEMENNDKNDEFYLIYTNKINMLELLDYVFEDFKYFKKNTKIFGESLQFIKSTYPDMVSSQMYFKDLLNPKKRNLQIVPYSVILDFSAKQKKKRTQSISKQKSEYLSIYDFLEILRTKSIELNENYLKSDSEIANLIEKYYDKSDLLNTLEINFLTDSVRFDKSKFKGYELFYFIFIYYFKKIFKNYPGLGRNEERMDANFILSGEWDGFEEYQNRHMFSDDLLKSDSIELINEWKKYEYFTKLNFFITSLTKKLKNLYINFLAGIFDSLFDFQFYGRIKELWLKGEKIDNLIDRNLIKNVLRLGTLLYFETFANLHILYLNLLVDYIKKYTQNFGCIYLKSVRSDFLKKNIFSYYEYNKANLANFRKFMDFKDSDISKNLIEMVINKWFKEFEIPYEFKVKFDVDIFDDKNYIFYLYDKNLKINLRFDQVGFGFSQIIPIIIQSELSFNDILLIEQPESQLHPKLQSRLADLFVENAETNQFFIETHSEYLIRRLQVLIKEGKIKADDVKIYYINKDEKGRSSALQMRLDENGRFLDEWPSGFFDESYNQSIALL